MTPEKRARKVLWHHARPGELNEAVAQALHEAEQRGRLEGLEEALLEAVALSNGFAIGRYTAEEALGATIKAIRSLKDKQS